MKSTWSVTDLKRVYLGKYRPDKFLGQGSMGRVILAHPVDEPSKNVVLKVIHAEAANHPTFLRYFERECKLTARLKHPYIVRYLDSGVDEKYGPCMVLEFIDGISLETILQSQQRVPLEKTAILLGQLCHALDSAHKLGVIHGDIKPANLLIDHPGQAREKLMVTDFGLASLVTRPHFSKAKLAGTEPRAFSGTPAYVAPEMLRGEEVDFRSDIYNVGVTLYELLTGLLPFAGEDSDEQLRSHLKEPPRSFAEVGRRDVPAEVERVVMLCLNKYPAERPADARKLADAFGRAVGMDLWNVAAPKMILTAESVDLQDETVERASDLTPPTLTRPNTLIHRIEAFMPEQMAILKINGFISETGARLVSADPGFLRLQVPKIASGLFAFLGFGKGIAGVQIDLIMEKVHPTRNELAITVEMTPVPFRSADYTKLWRSRSRHLLVKLQGYLMAFRN